MLGAVALAWYVATRAAIDAMSAAAPAVARPALAQAMPVGLAALLAAVSGATDVAVGVVFSASVAMLSLVLGIVVMAAPRRQPPVPPLRQPALGFILPAAVLAFLMGLSAKLTLLHAAILMVQGGAVAWAYRGSSPAPTAPTAPTAPAADPSPPARLRGLRRGAQLVLAIALASVAAWGGLRVVGDVRAEIGALSVRTIAALLLTPALVLPSIGAALAQVRLDRPDHAVGSLGATAMLNLCLVLPLAIVIAHVMNTLTAPAADGPFTLVGMVGDLVNAPVMVFPLIVWRIDTVMLMLLGMLLLPVALGRWRLGRVEGVVLLLLYTLYMRITAMQGMH